MAMKDQNYDTRWQNIHFISKIAKYFTFLNGSNTKMCEGTQHFKIVIKGKLVENMFFWNHEIKGFLHL